MGEANFIEDFERDVVIKITEGAIRLSRLLMGLGISKHSLHEWRKRNSKPAAVPRGNDSPVTIRPLTSAA